MTKLFVKCACIRALKTFCQTLASLITVGAMITEMDWITMISISFTSAVLSVLTSIVTDLPEVNMPTDEVGD